MTDHRPGTARDCPVCGCDNPRHTGDPYRGPARAITLVLVFVAVLVGLWLLARGAPW